MLKSPLTSVLKQFLEGFLVRLTKSLTKNVILMGKKTKCNISGFTVIEPQTKCLGTGDIKYKRSILKDVS